MDNHGYATNLTCREAITIAMQALPDHGPGGEAKKRLQEILNQKGCEEAEEHDGVGWLTTEMDIVING